MRDMPAIPESTKISLAQRLRAHAKNTWPQLAEVKALACQLPAETGVPLSRWSCPTWPPR